MYTPVRAGAEDCEYRNTIKQPSPGQHHKTQGGGWWTSGGGGLSRHRYQSASRASSWNLFPVQKALSAARWWFGPEDTRGQGRLYFYRWLRSFHICQPFSCQTIFQSVLVRTPFFAVACSEEGACAADNNWRKSLRRAALFRTLSSRWQRTGCRPKWEQQPLYPLQPSGTISDRQIVPKC